MSPAWHRLFFASALAAVALAAAALAALWPERLVPIALAAAALLAASGPGIRGIVRILWKGLAGLYQENQEAEDDLRSHGRSRPDSSVSARYGPP